MTQPNDAVSQTPRWIEEELADGDKILDVLGLERTEGGRLPMYKLLARLKELTAAQAQLAEKDAEIVHAHDLINKLLNDVAKANDWKERSLLLADFKKRAEQAEAKLAAITGHYGFQRITQRSGARRVVTEHPDMWLTPAELRSLTGRTYAKYQIDWLTERQWTWEPDANGKPKVLRSYAESRMGGKPVRRRGPNLTGLAAA
jgi:hypothetical protein